MQGAGCYYIPCKNTCVCEVNKLERRFYLVDAEACLFLESRPIGTFRERNPFSAEGSCGNLIVPSRHCSNGAT